MRLLIFLSIVPLLLSSCGTTVLIPDNQRAEVFVNGKYQGVGRAYIPRTGVPQKSNITTFVRGQQVGEVNISRSFDGVTFFAGMFTYGTGFFWAWRYPREVIIPSRSENVVDSPSQNIWMKPPGSRKP